MAVSPKDIGLTAYERANVGALEALIDPQLRSKFSAGDEGIEIDLRSSSHMNERRIVNELIRRYREAGWRVEDNANNVWMFYVAK